MPNPVAANDLQPISGSVQTSRISYGVETAGKNYGQNYNSTTWYSDIPNDGQRYTIITDNYTANYYVSRSQAEGGYVEGGLPAVDEYSAPVFWVTPGTSSLDVTTIVNGLPDRIGQTPFVSGAEALNWVASSSNYFAVGPDYYREIDADQMLFYVDANQVISYPTTQSTWYDLSGNTSNVDLQNSPSWDSNGWFSGDGVDDRFVINPTSINYSRTALTVEAFVYYNSSYSNYKGSIMSKWQTGAGTNNEWSLSSVNTASVATGPGNLGITFQYTSAGIQTVYGTTVMTTQKWYHTAATYDGSNIRLYVNGNLETTTAANASSYKEYAAQPTALLAFGDALAGGGSYYPTNARMSKARIYNKALTSDDIAQNYYGGPIVTDNLLFALDAGNLVSYPKTGTTVYPLTGSNNGTLTNGVGFSANDGGYFMFDGTNDYINVSGLSSAFQISQGSIEAWIKPSSDGTDQMVCGLGGGGTTGATRVIRINGSQWGYVGYGSGNEDWSNIAPVAFNTWAHVVIGWNGTALTFWLNGTRYDAVRSGIVTPNSSVIRLGIAPWSTSDRPFEGDIATFRMYSKLLSNAEVLQNYNATK